ncbi:MAG TPA: NUDIX hydrolase [Polyangiales bacterium]
MGSTSLKAWTLLEKQLAFQARIFRVVLVRWLLPRTQTEQTFTVIESPDFVNVVALDTQGNFVMIRQFRLGTERFTLETPGGMIDPGEHPRDTAERELYEESGYRPERITSLGFVETNPAIFNNRAHLFLAEGCARVGSQVLDEGEDIEVLTVPHDEVLAMLYDGRIRHALTAMSLHRYLLHKAGLLVLDPSLRSG